MLQARYKANIVLAIATFLAQEQHLYYRGINQFRHYDQTEN